MKLKFENFYYVLMGYIFAVCINIVLNLVLIKYYGILGASVATSISYMLIFIFFTQKAGMLKIQYISEVTILKLLPFIILIGECSLYILIKNIVGDFKFLWMFAIQLIVFCFIYLASLVFLYKKHLITIPEFTRKK